MQKAESWMSHTIRMMVLWSSEPNGSIAAVLLAAMITLSVIKMTTFTSSAMTASIRLVLQNHLTY